MKFSISVPDDLWREVHSDGAGPSDTVQRALAVLLDALMLQQLAAALCLDAGDVAGAERWARREASNAACAPAGSPSAARAMAAPNSA